MESRWILSIRCSLHRVIVEFQPHIILSHSSPRFFYDLQWIDEHKDEAIDQLIMIRELGTWMRPVNNGIAAWDSINGMPLQCWRVWSDDGELWTERVTLREVE